MTERVLYLTESDLEVLRLLIDRIRVNRSGQEQYLRDLENELARAQIVKPEEMPAGVVALYSTARLRDLDTGEIIACTLTLPDEADFEQGRVSVLAPIGTAILGYRERDVVEWPVPAGMRRLRIMKVRSPLLAEVESPPTGNTMGQRSF